MTQADPKESMSTRVIQGVLISVGAALVFSLATFFGNLITKGGVIKLLGGVTQSQLARDVEDATNTAIDRRIAALGAGTIVIPNSNDLNMDSALCDDGAFMIGAKLKSHADPIDPGGQVMRNGYLSNVQPICRTLAK